MTYRNQIKQVVEKFIPECEETFLTVFSLNDLDFGRDLMPGDRTGAIDWYSVNNNDLIGNAMIAIGCETRLSAEIEKATETLFVRHGIYDLNQSISRSKDLETVRVQVSGQVNSTTSQQVSSHIWLAIITLEIKCFIGL